jgi:fused signal recognition particle receptor
MSLEEINDSLELLHGVVTTHLAREEKYVTEMGKVLEKLKADVESQLAESGKLSAENQQLIQKMNEIAQNLKNYDPSAEFDKAMDAAQAEAANPAEKDRLAAETDRLAAEAKAEKDRLAAEAEKARVAAEAAENARLAAVTKRQADETAKFLAPRASQSKFGPKRGGRKRTRRHKRHSFRQK